MFVIPEVAKKCKPLAKIVGDTLVGAGEVFRKAAQPDAECGTCATAEVVAEPVAEETVVEAPVEEAPVEFTPIEEPAEPEEPKAE